MDKNSKSHGFTLIELLVVIAIIGILASVVLASLNTAREKAGDSAVKANLETVRKQAELYYSDQGNYGLNAGSGNYTGNCLTTGTMFQLSSGSTGVKAEYAAVITNAIEAANQSGRGVKECRMSNDRKSYVVSIGLKSSSDYWCIDHTGYAGNIGTTLPVSGQMSCS